MESLSSCTTRNLANTRLFIDPTHQSIRRNHRRPTKVPIPPVYYFCCIYHLKLGNDTSKMADVSSPQRVSARGTVSSRSLWRGQGSLSWIKIDAAGNSQVLDVDRMALMRHCKLPARDLRLLDPLFVYPSTILGREKAIVVNLERIRCIITADEVFLLNSLDNYALQYVTELQKRLALQVELDRQGSAWRSNNLLGLKCMMSAHSTSSNATRTDSHHSFSAETLPFEFRALEVALEATCTFLDSQVLELEVEAFPVLDELTSKINTINLERTRRLKSRLVALTSRVKKVRDELGQLMDDDGDMAEMYLTEKKDRAEAARLRAESFLGHSTVAAGASKSAPVSPVGSPSLSQNLMRSVSQTLSLHHSIITESGSQTIEELEMLLEAYFVAVDATLNKLLSLKGYIDDTEDFLNIQLDNVQNQLIQFELLLTTATFAVALVGVVFGVFGMNFPVSVFDEPGAFKWVIVVSGATGVMVFFSFLWFLKWQRLMPL